LTAALPERRRAGRHLGRLPAGAHDRHPPQQNPARRRRAGRRRRALSRRGACRRRRSGWRHDAVDLGS